MRRPCVVDDCRQSTEFGKRTIDEALDVAIACDVARAKSGRRAKRIGGFASVWFMDIVDDDTRAFGGEARGDAATESGAGARHDGDFVGEPHDQSCRTTTVFSVLHWRRTSGTAAAGTQMMASSTSPGMSRIDG